MDTAYQKYNVPQSLIIKDQKYTYKAFSNKQNTFTYRCLHRKCNSYIKISKDEIDKIGTNNKIEDIKFTSYNEHKHEKTENIIISSKDIKIKENLDNLAIKLIAQNILQPYEFHVKNFKMNNLNFKPYKIKNLLQLVREADIPKDETILADISQITIKLGDMSEPVPFCLSRGDIVNLRYKGRLERYCIFTSLMQMKIAADCDDWFMDATFKVAPKKWYQVFNIWGYRKKNDLYMPLANILMSQKSYELYDKIFREFKYLFDQFQIEIEYKNKSIMTDYERSLRNAIMNNFGGIKIRGCFFHYAKNIYKKCKDLKLFTKKKRKNTIIIAFILKIFPYIPKILRDEYIKNLERHINYLEDESYKSLLRYFRKNWLNNKYFSFSEISDEDIIKRTNNICESFHRSINNSISHYHPKIGFLLIKLKEYINKSYKQYIDHLIKNINIKVEKPNIAEDIYEFLYKYNNKIKSNINIYNFIANFDQFKDDLNNLIKKFIIYPLKIKIKKYINIIKLNFTIN